MTRQSLSDQWLPYWKEAEEVVFGLIPPPLEYCWDDLFTIIKVLRAYSLIERNSRLELLKVGIPGRGVVGLKQVYPFREEGCVLLNGVFVLKPDKLYYQGPSEACLARFRLDLLPLERLSSIENSSDAVEEFCEVDGKYYPKKHCETLVHPRLGCMMSVSEAKLRVRLLGGSLNFAGSLTQPRVAAA